FRAPYISRDELRRHATEFLGCHNPAGTIPVPIELIVEQQFGMDIVPIPGLQKHFDTVAFLTSDAREIRVDENVYLNRLSRYRFSLAHELAHRILHARLWQEFSFHDIASWKEAVSQSIPEKEYSYIEFHANTFAGLVLVPSPDLVISFKGCIAMAEKNGLDISDDATGALDLVEDYIGREFQVSAAVVHRRLEAEGLIGERYRDHG
ncbi:MAG: ImmA/IrrE family metallo-endopeptidase, partial [Patescibacteria group bacterium]|nr:ImmA/IrrE family metallo-endopeptidase [Patescibacteria group bacterium]